MDRKLYEAATTGNLKLLSEVADPALLSKAPHENTALHIAARLGHSEFIKSMLGRCPRLIGMKNSQGDTALHCAAGAGCLEAVDILTTAPLSADVEEGSAGILRMKNKEGNTALHQALRHSRTAAAIKLLRSDPELAFVANAAQESPLHLAAKEELQEFVQELLLPETANSNSEERKRDLVAKKDSTGRTALHYAAWRNNAATVEMILKIDCHIVPYATDEGGFSPLHFAAAFGSKESTSKLLESCPDAIEQLDQKGRNALHIAVLNRKKETLRKLLEIPNVGQKLNEQDQDGNTPLHLAALDLIDQVAGYKSSILNVLVSDERAELKMMNKAGQTVGDLYVGGPSGLKLESGRDAPYGKSRMVRAVIPIEENVEDQIFKSHSREETNKLVVTLIATVSFAAGITVPGGFRNDEPNPGTAILTRKAAFQAFILFDSFALFFSLSFIFVPGWRQISVAEGSMGNLLTFLASCFMMFAFAMGVYVVVLPRCKWLAILVCFLCFTGPFLFICAGIWYDDRLAKNMRTVEELPSDASKVVF